MNALEKKLNQLLRKISKIGVICPGTISTVFTKCGRSYCGCQKDDKQKHGPYYLWTRKINGKTVSRHLSKKQVEKCKQYIQNHRDFKALYDQIKSISSEMLLKSK